MKKLISTLLASIMLILALASIPAQAASWPATSGIQTYVLSTKNDTTVYQTATSTAKYGTIYASDLITIKGYSGSRLKVTYPVSGGTKTGYIESSKVTSSKINVSKSSYTAAAKTTTYRRASTSATLGYISKGDKVYVIVEKSNGWKQVIYPISGGYKMGWIKTPTTTTTSLGSPVPSGCYFNKKTNDNGWTGYHDINIGVSTSTPVYAIADGKIVCKQAYTNINGKDTLTSYGNFIEFTSSDGVYTAKYCHLNKFNGVTQKISSSTTKQQSGSKGTYTLATKTVKKGDIIGYIGKTGNASGVHLHFELYKNGSRVDPTSYISGLTK